MKSDPFCHCCHKTDGPMSEMTANQLAAYQSLLNAPYRTIATVQICINCSGLLEESQRFCQKHPFNINVCFICRQSESQLFDLVKLENFHDPKLQAVFSQKFGFLSEPRLKFCLDCMMRFEHVHSFIQTCFQAYCHQSSPDMLIQDVKHEQEEIIEDVELEDENINLLTEDHKPNEVQTRYNCEKCLKSFKYRKFYLEHMATHQGEWKVHKCICCEATFGNQLDLDKHSSLHQLDKISRKYARASEEFECPECAREFMCKLDVELHLYHEHGKMIGEAKTEFTSLPYPDGVAEQLKQIRVSHEGVTHRYECLQCGAKLRDRAKLKHHLLRVHSKVRPFACSQCVCSYKSKGSLTHHMKKHKNDEYPTVIAHEVFGSDDRDFPCRYCPKRYSSARKLTAHEGHQHINRRYYLCKFCDKQFVQRRSVWEHAFTHRDYFAYNCLECNYQANQRANFVKHLRKVHNQQFNSAVHEYTKETFEEVVEFALLSRERVEDIETKPKETPGFRCTKCVQTFETNEELLNHQLSHERYFQCHFCSEIYYHRRFIETHLAKHMAKKEAGVMAEPQPKTERKRVQKNAKIRPVQVSVPKNEATPLLMFSCPTCSKQFRSKIAANRHISQVHGTGWMFKCLVCSKFYPSPKSLKRHVETVHTSVKEFQCPDCLSTYKTQQSLTIHMRLHDTADNCFACQQCPKTFQSETGLAKHIKISHKHELEICSVCFKTFVTADGLFEHSFIHKGFDPFLCPKPDCPYTVKGKECFANHLIVHHGIVYDEKIYGYNAIDEERHRAAYLEKVQLLKLKRKYECHLCEGKRYLTKLSLLQHMTLKHLNKSDN